MGHLNRVGIAVAGSEVFIPRYGISETNMGWVYTAFLIAYTVGMLPGGWLIDRIGSVRTMTLFGLSMGLCILRRAAWVGKSIPLMGCGLAC